MIMSEVKVLPLPQTAPISDMRNRQDEILTMSESGPVVLMSRSKPAAVLLSPAYWDAIASALATYRQQTESSESVPPAAPAQDDNGVTEGISALAAIAALSQPLGPADLARNFDIYSKRVIDDGAAA
jgi:prevent-host-death family protein